MIKGSKTIQRGKWRIFDYVARLDHYFMLRNLIGMSMFVLRYASCKANRGTKRLTYFSSTEGVLLSKRKYVRRRLCFNGLLSIRDYFKLWLEVALTYTHFPKRPKIQRWLCNGLLWLCSCMWRLGFLLSCACLSSQPGGELTLKSGVTGTTAENNKSRLSNVTILNCHCVFILQCSFMWMQVAESFQAEDLGLHVIVLEQSFSHHDHHTHCSLPRWVLHWLSSATVHSLYW